MKKNLERANAENLKGRVLARVLAEDLQKVAGDGTKSVGCGTGCDEIVNDCWKLRDDSY